nr:hypothetical protein CFP56_56817 [Quercus suber]
MGGTVDQVENCDLDRWSKVEIESICRDFGYTAVDRLWFKMIGVNPKHANFHQVVNDDVVVFMTNLVKGYEEIHVFVEHPVDEPLELLVEDFEPLDVRQPGEELEDADHGVPNEVDAEQVYARRPDKEPVAEDQQ